VTVVMTGCNVVRTTSNAVLFCCFVLNLNRDTGWSLGSRNAGKWKCFNSIYD